MARVCVWLFVYGIVTTTTESARASGVEAEVSSRKMKTDRQPRDVKHSADTMSLRERMRLDNLVEAQASEMLQLSNRKVTSVPVCSRAIHAMMSCCLLKRDGYYVGRHVALYAYVHIRKNIGGSRPR